MTYQLITELSNARMVTVRVRGFAASSGLSAIREDALATLGRLGLLLLH